MKTQINMYNKFRLLQKIIVLSMIINTIAIPYFIETNTSILYIINILLYPILFYLLNYSYRMEINYKESLIDLLEQEGVIIKENISTTTMYTKNDILHYSKLGCNLHLDTGYEESIVQQFDNFNTKPEKILEQYPNLIKINKVVYTYKINDHNVYDYFLREFIWEIPRVEYKFICN